MKKYLILVMLTIIAVMPVEAKKKKFPNGDYYEGGWKKKSPHGEGTMIYANGEKYVGFWEYGKKNGQGIFTYKNGSVYDGQWYQDEKRGQGKYKIDDLTVIGEWNKGIINNATIKNKKLKRTFKGTVEERLLGDGTFAFYFKDGRLDFINGDYFDGKWGRYAQIDESPIPFFINGNCKIQEKNRVFEGTMVTGHLSEGILKSSDGDYMEGTWKDDKFYNGKYIVNKRNSSFNGRLINGTFEGACSIDSLGKRGDYQIDRFVGVVKMDTLIGKMSISGKEFDGYLINGKKQLSGVLNLSETDYIEGYWINDVLDSGEGQFECICGGIRQIYNFTVGYPEEGTVLEASIDAADGFSFTFPLDEGYENGMELIELLKRKTQTVIMKTEIDYYKNSLGKNDFFAAKMPTSKFSPDYQLLFDIHALETTVFVFFNEKGEACYGYMTELNTDKLRSYDYDRGYLLQQSMLAERISKLNQSFFKVDGNIITIDGNKYKHNPKTKQLLDLKKNITMSSIDMKEYESGRWQGLFNGIYSLTPQKSSTSDSPHLTPSKAKKSVLTSLNFDYEIPCALVRNVSPDGKVSKSALLAANEVWVPVEYGKIISYRVKTKELTMQVDGPNFSEVLKSEINSSRSGQVFVFSDIKVKQSDGTITPLKQTITIEIN